ncbi:ABC transporter permease [Paenibacillus swuensis]|uniref:ABC transporter permease n=1 Tax=Paenibacillus swuensis TaxID=1178515 RepID=A0A172TLC1_9BACL|nr:carbohydrate ABC transporter permease [Paenibacillus swuensis]ANE47714.1 ABC transporter permease [Paenibacillus swuensis]
MWIRIAGWGLLAVFAVIILGPLLLVLSTSFKTTPQFITDPLGIPPSLSFHNYITIFQGQQMWRYISNSAIVTGSSVFIELVISGMIAYGITRLGRLTSTVVFGFFALGMMIPSQVNIIPIYLLVNRLGWNNSLSGLTAVTVAMLIPLSVFMLTGFMRTLPKEMMEAASIDGAGEWRLLTQIAVPLCAPFFAATAAFLFVIVWNDLLFPMLLVNGSDKLTLPLAMLRFRGEYVTDYPMLLTGVTIATIPMVIMFVFLQRYFISGTLAGAVKG